ncbi:multicopper oxidase family protein [Pseudotabrizicola algicola]|uniref:Multicopper oxidase domain-containing protein n=1 Tax=Pseudotabrizicola algicola TaxID=2709381 RepID=A0A6B3RQX4_9RHOB|nr:multicopper oxidase domain-containing protein [Pseudotabrizicola algicola]NEX48564.1 multicopper oxidase domain-containing protein [Pseudotabrizicola algicola]
MIALSRRGFLAASAATAASLILPARARAQSARMSLTATTRTLDVRGKAATVWGLLDGNGRSGLVLDPGQAFAVDLANTLAEATIIHWHGQIPPNVQDGVPDMPMATLQPGESRAYDFAARPGTHWMHAHIPEHEMLLLAAPLVVRRPEDVAADRQDVTMFLHDFSFKSPAEVLAEITGGASMAGMDHSQMGQDGMAGMDMGAMGQGDMMAMPGMDGMAMDLNDYNFDAYLANDRTLDDPEVLQVDKGSKVLVRVINAAAATVFWIDTGALTGRLVAVDGEPVQPLPGSRFGIAMGQRLDIEIDVPAEGGAFPVLALREGARERTGLVLATPGATVTKVADMSDADHPAFSADLTQEAALRAFTPLPERAASSQPMLMLGGSMMPYVWTINGQTWGKHSPVSAKTGERVEIMFHNMSMMAHPMHLHGHAFQVVGVGQDRIAGAVRDTVHVPPMGMVTVAVDAGEVARWMLHCHHMPHLSTGMMTEFAVSA